MLLQTPWARVYKVHSLDPERYLCIISVFLLVPSDLVVTSWQEFCPCFAEKVGDEDNESTSDGD